MCDNDLADGVGVDQTHKEDKRHQMIVEDDRVECKVERDDSPGNEVWNKSK